MEKKCKKCGKLTKEELESIKGGKHDNCEGHVSNDVYGPYNGGVYSSQTLHYHCLLSDGTWGPWQTGPWGIPT